MSLGSSIILPTQYSCMISASSLTFCLSEQKLGKISYWGGAEKRDDRIFAPDLGSLSSVHDR